MKKIIYISFWSILILGVFIILGFINVEQNGIICNNIDIDIDYGNADCLITNTEINREISQLDNNIIGSPYSEIETDEIERIIKNNPFVKNANAYVSLKGDLKIFIEQRQPVIRIIDQYGQSYYIDNAAAIIHTSNR